MQAASKAWVLGTPKQLRLYLVCPPVPASHGNGSSVNRFQRALRVAFTAAAACKGGVDNSFLALFGLNMSTGRLLFFLLQKKSCVVVLSTLYFWAN